jgi:2'-5' RNA ligase
MPSRLRDILATHVSKCKTILPPAKWVSRDRYHITLSFVGEVETKVIGRFDRPLAQAVLEQQSFRLRLFKSGCFPRNLRGVRVVWVGVEDQASVILLQKRVATSLNEAGLLDSERRPYHPHVTVGRCRKPWNRLAGESWVSSLDGPLGEGCTVSEIILYRSRLEGTGAFYDRLGSYSFGGLN